MASEDGDIAALQNFFGSLQVSMLTLLGERVGSTGLAAEAKALRTFTLKPHESKALCGYFRRLGVEAQPSWPTDAYSISLTHFTHFTCCKALLWSTSSLSPAGTPCQPWAWWVGSGLPFSFCSCLSGLSPRGFFLALL